MCRHLAYVGPAVGAALLLLDAPRALAVQADAPRHQDRGITNRDGWGVAWIDDDGWQRHRSVLPLSEDPEARAALDGVAPTALIAAVRRASPGLALVESGNAPFVDGPWAFSLNGFVGGWSSGQAVEPLRAEVSQARLDALQGDTDSEVLFALVRDHLDAGVDPADALLAAVGAAEQAAAGTPGRLNLLLGDGESIWATSWGNSLFVRESPGGGVAVASEPWDDDADWQRLGDHAVVEVPAGRPARTIGA